MKFECIYNHSFIVIEAKIKTANETMKRFVLTIEYIDTHLSAADSTKHKY